ncbi:MAG: response regulator transcription factor [Rhodobacterales bacterium]|nr:response regulator transcription factor [Rhodobacterales bacterium]
MAGRMDISDSRPFASALIVEDHPLFSEALAMTLRTFIGIERIETADRLETALARLKAGSVPDVIILDLHLPDVTGMDGLIRLKHAAQAVPVIVVSSFSEGPVISAAMQAGAAGYVPKHSQRDVFRAAFAAIRAGGRYTPEGYQPTATDAMGRTSRDEVIERLGLLTRQQAVILKLICEGKLNKQIAYELSVAETTVKAHVTAIMRKLGVYSRTQAVLIAREVNFSALLSENNLSA